MISKGLKAKVQTLTPRLKTKIASHYSLLSGLDSEQRRDRGKPLQLHAKSLELLLRPLPPCIVQSISITLYPDSPNMAFRPTIQTILRSVPKPTSTSQLVQPFSSSSTALQPQGTDFTGTMERLYRGERGVRGGGNGGSDGAPGSVSGKYSIFWTGIVSIAVLLRLRIPIRSCSGLICRLSSPEIALLFPSSLPPSLPPSLPSSLPPFLPSSLPPFLPSSLSNILVSSSSHFVIHYTHPVSNFAERAHCSPLRKDLTLI